MDMATEQFNFRMDTRIVAELEKIALANHRPMRNELELALIDYIRQYDPNFMPEVSPR